LRCLDAVSTPLEERPMIDPKKQDQTPRQGPPPEDPERTLESTLPTPGQSPGKPDSTQAERAAGVERKESDKPATPTVPPPVNYPPKLI